MRALADISPRTQEAIDSVLRAAHDLLIGRSDPVEDQPTFPPVYRCNCGQLRTQIFAFGPCEHCHSHAINRQED